MYKRINPQAPLRIFEEAPGKELTLEDLKNKVKYHKKRLLRAIKIRKALEITAQIIADIDEKYTFEIIGRNTVEIDVQKQCLRDSKRELKLLKKQTSQ